MFGPASEPLDAESPTTADGPLSPTTRGVLAPPPTADTESDGAVGALAGARAAGTVLALAAALVVVI